LGRPVTIDEVRLLPVRPTDFADEPGHGFPVRFRVEASLDAEFAKPIVLLDSTQHDFVNPGDNLVIIPAKRQPARFVRVTATQLWFAGDVADFALAELQVYSDDHNVALGAQVTASDEFGDSRFPRWSPQYLVDGYNSHHRLAEIPDWLAGLARGYEVASQLRQLDRDREVAIDGWLITAMRATAAVVASLVGGLGLLVWRQRSVRKRQVESLRAQIAADLHDDIGGNLGTIAWVSQMAMLEENVAPAIQQELARLESQPQPQAILLDINLPGMDGIEGLGEIHQRAPEIKVIILTVFDDQDRVFRAICAGASGYLLKTAPLEKIGEAIHEVIHGGAPINPRIARRMLDLFARISPPSRD
jgi:CheY-like chemotaxis protein